MFLLMLGLNTFHIIAELWKKQTTDDTSPSSKGHCIVASHTQLTPVILCLKVNPNHGLNLYIFFSSDGKNTP